jgi:hypothetical protein
MKLAPGFSPGVFLPRRVQTRFILTIADCGALMAPPRIGDRPHASSACGQKGSGKMSRISQAAFGAALFSALGILGAAPSQAQTAIQQCSAKYQAAKTAGTLNGQTWNQFRSKCQAELKAQPTAATANPLKPTTAATRATAPAGNVVFPRAVDPKYGKESAGKARQKTCLDQYNANKANGGNGSLKWIQKGGGYYSQCNARLKG